ncbi:hypothetical protein [Leucobacter sp. cx-169]|uniref:hypothetical protein n=1 Tax=Leucobacter sp. cx-169 TaxID=2770549 RepID=UPI00165D6A0B|nr:hypothetical protein [Leucobacter sp. cx-169]MBC9927221.1 hypothetical protein [Leucobacter sp. cx-169]
MSALIRHKAGTVTAGQQSGGRFKQLQREAATGPAAPRTRWLSDEETRYATELMEERFYSSVVAKHGRRADRVRDDIIQDTIIDLGVRAQAMGIERLNKSHAGLTVRIMQARAISNIYSEHHTAASGRKALEKHRQEFEASLGRELSSSEISELAEEVRLSFAPGRRPTVGYHEEFEASRLHRVAEEIGANAARAGVAYRDVYPTEMDPERSEHLEQVLESLQGEEGDAVSKKYAKEALKEARSNVWTMLQSATPGLPPALGLSAWNAQKQRAALTAVGGAHEAARQYLSGALDGPGADALFSPFGIRDGSDGAEDREAVAQKLAATGDAAGKVWSSAAQTRR